MIYLCIGIALLMGTYCKGEDGKVIFNIQNTTEQSDQTPPYKCYQMQGEGLKQCFCCLLREEKKETFKKFPPEIRRMALQQLVLGDYREFLNSWTEQEWSSLRVGLSDEERRQFPKTVKEQKQKLDAIELKVNRLSTLAEWGLGFCSVAVPGLQLVRLSLQFGYLCKYGCFPTTQGLRAHYYHLFLEKEFGITWSYA